MFHLQCHSRATGDSHTHLGRRKASSHGESRPEPASLCPLAPRCCMIEGAPGPQHSPRSPVPHHLPRACLLQTRSLTSGFCDPEVREPRGDRSGSDGTRAPQQRLRECRKGELGFRPCVRPAFQKTSSFRGRRVSGETSTQAFSLLLLLVFVFVLMKSLFFLEKVHRNLL